MSNVVSDSDPDEIPFIRPTTTRRRGRPRRRTDIIPSSPDTATPAILGAPPTVSPAPPIHPSDYIQNLLSTPRSRSLSQDELALQPARHAEIMRRSRESEAANETRRRRTRDAEARRAARAAENEEEAAERRRRNAVSMQASRAAAPDEITVARREADTSAHRQQRLNQTARQRADINANRRQQRRIDPTHAGLSDQPLPEPHDLGHMNEICSHCGAKFFSGEFPRDSNGTYNVCCRNGSVTLDLFRNYPPQLLDLFVGNDPRSRNFLEYIRQFNTAMAVASMNVKLATPAGRGPFVFKAHGAICYETGQAMPFGTPSYGQLFFIDETAATDARMTHSANQNCDRQLMEDLGVLIRSQHEYAREFKTLQEVYEEEEEKARRLNTPMSQMGSEVWHEPKASARPSGLQSGEAGQGNRALDQSSVDPP